MSASGRRSALAAGLGTLLGGAGARAAETAAPSGASAAGPASTDPANVLFLEDLTWPELRERVAAGARTALIPVGGTEQNGPHMALGKHNVRVRLMAERIARRLGDALILPVMAYVPEGEIDPPASHMRFPGTLSISASTFESLLESAARSARRHGFSRIVVLGEHGGYQQSLTRVEARFNADRRNAPARMFAATVYYTAAQETFAAELVRGGLRKEEIGTHAGMLDTSLSLALAPSLVRSQRLSLPPEAAQGTYGDPRKASAAWGERGVALIVDATVRSIRAAF